MRDCWNSDGSRPVTNGELVWTGDNQASRKYELRLFPRRLRLYRLTLENPRPEQECVSVAFESAATSVAAPLLVAITRHKLRQIASIPETRRDRSTGLRLSGHAAGPIGLDVPPRRSAWASKAR